MRRRLAAVAAGINNAVFGELYRVSRSKLDQYGNETGVPLSFDCCAVPQDKEFSQKLDGERLGADFKGDLTLVVPMIRFRQQDLPDGFVFQEGDRIEQLEHEKRAFVVEFPLEPSSGLIQVKVSLAGDAQT